MPRATGNKGMNMATNMIGAIISVVIVLEVARYLYPLARYALGNLSADLAGWQLIGLFGVSGLVTLLLMVGLFYLIYRLVTNMLGGR